MQSLSPGVVDTEIFGVGGWRHFDIQKIAHLRPEEVAEGLIAILSASENVLVSYNLFEFIYQYLGED